MSDSTPRTDSERGRRRIGLELKLIAALLMLSLLPLTVSALLVGNIGEVAQNFASHHVETLRPHLRRAQDAYRQVIAAKKSEFGAVSQRLATNAALGAVVLEQSSPVALTIIAKALLEEHDDLVGVHILSEAGQEIGIATRDSILPADRVRELKMEEAIGISGATLELVFAADMQPVLDLQALGEALETSRQVDSVKSSLPNSYRNAFLLLVGGVVVVGTILALLFARRLSRRISSLVAGTRDVAGGDLDVRVDLGGQDEFAELAASFNTMVGDLQNERQKTLYLQRIGAWQDVARKLAHEIKNPLTPIQLVVQQAVSSYPGDDARYKKLLASCDEIVREEVDGLKRLVDAFRDLGRLPKVEASALALHDILGDLRANAELEPHLEIVDVDPDMVVSADRLLLRRALVNLLENGVQACCDGEGKVTLRCESVGNMARFTIDDPGAGVPESKREHIFDPYVTSKETGTGLGLAIAKKVALDHHGALYLDENSSPQGGARFVLEVPLVRDSAIES